MGNGTSQVLCVFIGASECGAPREGKDWAREKASKCDATREGKDWAREEAIKFT